MGARHSRRRSTLGPCSKRKAALNTRSRLATSNDWGGFRFRSSCTPSMAARDALSRPTSWFSCPCWPSPESSSSERGVDARMTCVVRLGVPRASTFDVIRSRAMAKSLPRACRAPVARREPVSMQKWLAGVSGDGSQECDQLPPGGWWLRTAISTARVRRARCRPSAFSVSAASSEGSLRASRRARIRHRSQGQVPIWEERAGLRSHGFSAQSRPASFASAV